jgi:hypothetical protein
MAFTAIDIDISGQGTYDVGSAANMLFWEVFLDTLGLEVRIPEATDTDKLLRAGWISWGDNNSVIGGVDRIYWKPPIWLDFTAQIFTTPVDSLGGNSGLFVAHYFRWSLSAGTSGHIYGYAL